ncbi:MULTISPECIES: PKD domain-containing protein [Halobacteriovorax]|uniref:PKD domain-containing protein n=1 Tax=Halobacteriovorax TaxID=1652133 RepID=UPI001314BD61|nr:MULTISPECIES: RHS repeat-associated core domain-containing protein [Halobacteriovorax]
MISLILVLLTSISVYAECSVPDNYDPSVRCRSNSVVVTNTQELNDYLNDFGRDKNRYQALTIDGIIVASQLNIFSPCGIKIKRNSIIQANNLCVKSGKKLTLEDQVNVMSNVIDLSSNVQKLTIGKSNTFQSGQMNISSNDIISVGDSTSLQVSGELSIATTSKQIAFGSSNIIKVGTLKIVSGDNISFNKSANIDASEDIELIADVEDNAFIKIKNDANIKSKNFTMKSNGLAVISNDSHFTIEDSILIQSLQSYDSSAVRLHRGVEFNAKKISLLSDVEVNLGAGLVITSDIAHLDAEKCVIRPTSIINADVKTGRCFGVVDINSKPVAKLGFDKKLILNNKYILDGSESYDLDSEPLSYNWTVLSSPTNADYDFINVNTPFAEFVSRTLGEYVFQLEISDGKDVDSKTVTISSLNLSPQITELNYVNSELGTQVQLSPEVVDYEEDNLTYSWSLIESPTGSTAQVIDGNLKNAKITPDVDGQYILELSVSDGSLAKTSKFILTTQGESYDMSLEDIRDAVRGVDYNVTVTGEFNNFKWNVLWSEVGDILSPSDTTLPNVTLISSALGKAIIQVHALNSLSKDVVETFVFESINQIPLVNIVNVSNSTIFEVGSSVQLDASSSSDADGDNLTFSWEVLERPEGSTLDLSTNTSSVTSFVADQAGEYTIKCIVNDGFDTNSSTIAFSANTRPVANFTIESKAYLGYFVDVLGSGSDADGDGLVYTWNIESAPDGSMTSFRDNGRDTSGLIFDKVGYYTISLVVSDGSFDSQKVSKSIQVLEFVNNPPVIEVLDAKTISLGDEFNFNVPVVDSDTQALSFGLVGDVPEGVKFDPLTGHFKWHPGKDQAGEYNFRYYVYDGDNKVFGDIDLIVNGVSSIDPTIIVGSVADSNATTGDGVEVPVVGATISIIGTDIVTTTDHKGQFILKDLPIVDQYIFKIDSSTAELAPDGSKYANFIEAIHVIPNATNIVHRPFYVPRLAMDSITDVVPDEETNVINDDLGIEVIVPPNSAKNKDGTPFTGQLSVSVVPKNLAPVSLPDKFNPAMLITVQPSGVKFEEQANITYPNLDNLPPGLIVDIYQMNDALGRFEVVGKSRVSDDGKRLELVEGGLVNTSWGFTAPRPPEPQENDPDEDDDDPGDCTKIDKSKRNKPEEIEDCGSTILTTTGELFQDFSIDSYKTLGKERTLTFSYGAKQAHGIDIYEFEVQRPTAAPLKYNANVTLGGMESPFTIEVPILEGDEFFEYEQFDVKVPFDFSNFNTGLHKINAKIEYHFSETSMVSANVHENNDRYYHVVNYRDSEFGNGWTISELERIIPSDGDDFMYLYNGFSAATIRKKDSGYTLPRAFKGEIRLENGVFVIEYTDKTKKVFNTEGFLSYVVTRNGEQTSYIYDSENRISKIIDPTGKAFEFEYQDNLLSKVTDPFGRLTEFVYSEDNTLIEVRKPGNRVLKYNYDKNLMISKSDEENHVTQYSFNEYGQVISMIKPDGLRTDYFTPFNINYHKRVDESIAHAYEAKHAVSNFYKKPARTVLDYSGIKTYARRPEQLISNLRAVKRTQEYCLQDTRPIYGMKGEGDNRRWGVVGHSSIPYCMKRDSNGRLTNIIDSNGGEEYLAYDAVGNTTLRVDKTGRSKRYVYDDFNNLIQYAPNVDLDNPVIIEYKNGTSFVKSITDRNGNKTIFNLDDRGNVREILDSNYNVTRLSYNNKGQVTQVSDAKENKTLIEYDEYTGNMTKVTDSLGNSVEYSFDLRGNIKTITDQLGRTTTMTYDIVDNLRSVKDSEDRLTYFEYDKKNNLVKVTDSKQGVTQFVYDTRDRVVERIDPMAQSEFFTYDDENNVTSHIDKDNRLTIFEYDDQQRLKEASYSDGNFLKLDYDSEGRVIKSENSNSSYTISYDNEGRVKTVSNVANEFTPEFSYTNTYDNNGNIEVVNTSLGQILNEYDKLNRLISITAFNQNPIKLTYDKLSRRTKLENINSTVDYSFDKISRLVKIATNNDFLQEFGYDKTGNKTSISQTRTPFSKLNTSLSFTYDKTGQILTATGPVAGQADESFEYDENGNRIYYPGNTSPAQYDANNRLTETEDELLTYDNSGNTTSIVEKATGHTTMYEWNSLNQLTGIKFYNSLPEGAYKSVEYKYDSFGRRTYKKINDLEWSYVYHNEDIIAQYRKTGTGFELVKKIIHGPGIDEPLAAIGDGYTQTYVADSLGSIVKVVKDNGESVDIAYSAFGKMNVFNSNGEAMQLSETSDMIYGYTGREVDPESNLYYYRARYYNPSAGRFMSEDPIGFSGGDFNKYRYVFNNSKNNIDPSGQVTIGAILSLVNGIATAATVYQLYEVYSDIKRIESMANSNSSLINELKKKLDDNCLSESEKAKIKRQILSLQALVDASDIELSYRKKSFFALAAREATVAKIASMSNFNQLDEFASSVFTNLLGD